MPSTEFSTDQYRQHHRCDCGTGTAAYGLVDASKAVRGGASNPGFGHIRSTVQSFLPEPSNSAFGPAQILDTLRANWLNGVGKAEQKAAAKALIRLTLTQNNACRLAKATGVSASAAWRRLPTRSRAATILRHRISTCLGSSTPY